MSASSLIDVWNVASFDNALLAKLRGEEVLVRDYLTTRQQLFDEREAARGLALVQENIHGEPFQSLVEDVGLEMKSRTIRAWHYTRLEDDEVELIRKQGLHASTLDSLRRRLDQRVKAGAFSGEVADALHAASPIHHQPQRSGKFYMTSEPVPIDDTGVKDLLGNWGGEATYFWLKDDELKKIVSAIGRARVLEIAVPVASTQHWYHAGKAVVCAFARTLALPADRGDFDLHCPVDLRPQAVQRIHSAGETDFAAVGRGYPTEFMSDR